MRFVKMFCAAALAAVVSSIPASARTTGLAIPSLGITRPRRWSMALRGGVEDTSIVVDQWRRH